jgi:uncharacterized protein (DUF1697 family)/GNAT superfamily N-acetyltransferase
MEPAFKPGVAGEMVIPGELTFEALSKSNWNQFVGLFGEKGACGNCWCMAFRLKKADFEVGKANDGNKNLMKQLVWNNQPTGILGIWKGKAVSWCAFAPRDVFRRLENSRVHKRIDDKPVWSIPCFFIGKEFRKQGLSVTILEGIIDYARKNNIGIIEAYPVIPTKGKLPDPFVWTGLFKSFARAGFQIADQTSKNRPMVRYVLKESSKFVAFLRGINVGGRKIIKMEELNHLLTSAGYMEVHTLIQSGNVIFTTAEKPVPELENDLEALLKLNLGLDVRVLIRSMDELKRMARSQPFSELKIQGRSKFYLSLLSSHSNVKISLPLFSANKDLEVTRIDGRQAYIVSHEINGRFGFPNNFIEEILGVEATTRNWNTIEKLVKV